MILSDDQIRTLSKSFKINESVVLREYAQLVFLKELYDENYSKHIFFKGGTAIRLVFGGTRFSEDLDFTVEEEREKFVLFINGFFRKIGKLYGFTFKSRKNMAGATYLLTTDQKYRNSKVFIKLDFSFLEKVLMPSQSTIQTEYPVLFTSFVKHLSPEEIVAEKIRVLLSRNKGRDIYDLWFLLNRNIPIVEKLVLEKLKYYDIKQFSYDQLKSKIKEFSREQFVLDLRPFVPIGERAKLADFFDYIISYLEKKLTKQS